MAARVRKRLLKQRRFRQLIVALVILAIWLGLLIVLIERRHPSSDFHTFFDGFYWSVTTLTTVGYGDLVPVTIAGKWISIFLQLLGALMFGLVIAIISHYVSRQQDEFYWNRLFERMDRLEDELKDLKRHNKYLVKKEILEDAEAEKNQTQASRTSHHTKKSPQD